MREEYDSYRRVNTEFQNIQKSFDSVEDRILQTNIDEIVSAYNPKPDPYRINQTNQYTERSNEDANVKESIKKS
jgi:hypothetical protein